MKFCSRREFDCRQIGGRFPARAESSKRPLSSRGKNRPGTMINRRMSILRIPVRSHRYFYAYGPPRYEIQRMQGPKLFRWRRGRPFFANRFDHRAETLPAGIILR